MKFIFTFLFVTYVFLSKAATYELFEQNGKMGIKDDRGQVVIPPSFEALGWSDGSFSVIGETTGYRVQNQWGLINLKKEFITPAEFEELVYQGGEFVVARKKLNPVSIKSGCISLSGEIVIPFLYDGIKVSGLRAIVFNLTGSRFSYGLTNMNNEVLIPLLYKDIHSLGTLRYAVENREGKLALFNEDGKAITDFKIDSISNFYKGYSIIYENGLQGLINREGQIKAVAQYRAINIKDEETVLAQLPGVWRYLSSQNEESTKWLADAMSTSYENNNIIELGGKSGLMDTQQKLLIPIQYDKLQEYAGKYLAKKRGKWGLIGSTNHIIVPFVYDTAYFQSNKLIAFTKGKGWSLLDSSGTIKTQKYYDFLLELDASSFKAYSKGYWGIVNDLGDEVVHCVFDSIIESRMNLVAVKFKGLYGILDLKENWMLAPQLYPIKLVNTKRYVLRKPNNSFLMSFANETIYFTPYRMEFEVDNWKEILPDGSGNVVSYDGLIQKKISPKENQLVVNSTEKIGNIFKERNFMLSEGLQGISKDGKFGFVDATGVLRIANRYDSISDFHDGLAPVKLIGMWGFINRQDNIVVQPNYQSVTPFTNGLSIVKRNNKYGLIDKSGSFRLTIRYDSIHLLQNGKYVLILNHLKGIANEKGHVDIEPRFDLLEDLNNDLIIVARTGKYGLLTSTGLDRIPLVYDKLIFDPAKNQYLAFIRSGWKELVLE